MLIPLFLLSMLVTFDTLPPIHDDPVGIEIRGFLYPLEDGQWILAKEPKLKSCCVKKSPHLYLEDLKGAFSPSKAYLLEGKLFSGLILKEVKLVEEETSYFFPGALFVMLVALTLKKYFPKLPLQKLRA